ncbi:MAG: helix-turn-helix domain-containing protein [Halanaerobiaceae bacterium]
MNEKSNIIGKKIREMRLSRNLNLSQVAEKIDKTASYLSQIERGKAEPSISTLREIAGIFDVPIFYFLFENENHRFIVRKEQRKTLASSGSDLSYELLSPDIKHKMEIVEITLQPNSSSSEEPLSHRGEEFILVLKGTMEIQLGNEFHQLNEGDSIYFLSSINHKIQNIDDKEELVFISAITPPKF